MIHGRRSSYVAGCRCDACRRAHADYHLEYKHRRRQAVAPVVADAPARPEPERHAEPYWVWRR